MTCRRVEHRVIPLAEGERVTPTISRVLSEMEEDGWELRATIPSGHYDPTPVFLIFVRPVSQ